MKRPTTRGDDDEHSRPGGRQGASITSAAWGQGANTPSAAEEGADTIAVDVCGDIDGAPYPLATEADLDETVALVEKWTVASSPRRRTSRMSRPWALHCNKESTSWAAPDIVIANAGISGSPPPLP